MTDDHRRQAEGAAFEMRPPSGDVIPGRHLIVTRGSQIKLRPLEWWEPGLILRSAITLLAGREGKGKSTIAASWAARESQAGGVVMWIGSEEPREQAQAPRLTAAGADMERIIFVDVEVDKSTRMLMFPLDLPAIEKIITDHAVTMIVLDPCKGLMPSGMSGNDDIAVRQYLEPIAAMAARRDIVLLGLAHFGKRAGDDSGKLLLGSVAWSQVARSVLSVAEDPDTGHRIITATKGNYAEHDRSIECRLVSKTITTVDGPSVIGAVEWLGDTAIDARDLLAGNSDEDPRDVDRWLTDFLGTGSKKANDVYSAADAAGHSKDQAKRAKKRLGIKAERPNGDGPWFWSMPAKQGSTHQGSTPLTPEPAPLLPSWSEGVQEPVKTPREQAVHDCSLGTQTPTPATMPSRVQHSTTPSRPARQRLRTFGKYRPPTGPGRCTDCGWHVESQGHNDDCNIADMASA